MRRALLVVMSMMAISCSHTPQKSTEAISERKPSQAQGNTTWNDCFVLFNNSNQTTICIYGVPADPATQSQVTVALFAEGDAGIEQCYKSADFTFNDLELQIKSEGKGLVGLRSSTKRLYAHWGGRGKFQKMSERSFLPANPPGDRMEIAQKSCGW